MLTALLCRNATFARHPLKFSLSENFSGAGGDRTRDLLTASQALSQLSHSPKILVPKRRYRGKVEGRKHASKANIEIFWSYNHSIASQDCQQNSHKRGQAL